MLSQQVKCILLVSLYSIYILYSIRHHVSSWLVSVWGKMLQICEGKESLEWGTGRLLVSTGFILDLNSNLHLLFRLIWPRSTALRRINLWQICLTGESSGWAERWDGPGLTELLGTTRTGVQAVPVGFIKGKWRTALKMLLWLTEKKRRGCGMIAVVAT